MLLAAAGTSSAQERDGTAPAGTSDKQRTEDLAQRLLEGSGADDDGDLMSRIVALMDEARRRLYRGFDPGPETQAVQQKIMQNLDDAIKLALQHRAKSSAAASGAGDKRRMPDPSGRDESDQSRPDREGAQGGPSSTSAPDADAPDGRRSGPLTESRRGWGHLPPRQREEIIQGIRESVLEGYRELIDRYYRALAETEEP